MLKPSWILCGLFLIVPMSAAAQSHSPELVPDNASVSFLMVLVDDHEFGEMPAVLRYVQEGPFAGGTPLLLIRDRDVSPHLIQAAAQVTLSLMERGHDRSDADLMVPIPAVGDRGRPASWWAEDAFDRLQSASPVVIPGIGRHRTASLGIDAGMLRRMAPGRE